MKSSPEEIAARFMLKLHLAGKGYPSPRETGTPFFHEAKEPARRHPVRVTDNRASWHLRRKDHDSTRTPAREIRNTLAGHHERVSLIIQALITWGAVAWMVWYVFL